MHKNKFFWIIILVLIGVFSHLQWFNPFSVLTHSDWYYWPALPVKELWHAWGTWLSFWNFGTSNIQIPFMTFNGVWSLLVRLGFTFDQAVKVTFLIPIAIMGFLAPYILFRNLYKDDTIAAISALFYGTTTYFLVKQTAHLPIAFVYALAPLVLYFFIEALEKPSTKRWLAFALIYVLGIGYELRIMFIVTAILALYFLISVRSIKGITYVYVLLGGLLIIAMNAYWILPSLRNSGAISAVAGRGLFGNALFSLTHALTLSESSWTGHLPNQNFVPQPIMWFFWLWPIFAFVAFFMKKHFNNRQSTLLYFFGVLALIGIFLTKQSAAPFDTSYQWAYDNLPGFSLFREASKFYLLIAIGYAGLIGLTLIGLRKTESKKLKNIAFGTSAFILVFLALFNLKPIFLNQFGTMFVPRHKPSDYTKLESFIEKQPNYFRTYWLPTYSRWSTYSTNHPEISAVDAMSSDWKQFVGYEQHDSKWPQRNQITDILSQPYGQSLLASASVKYVIVPLQDKANDDDFFKYYGNDRQFFLDAANKASYLKRIDIGTKDLAVYENKNFAPHISAIDNPVALDSFSNISDKYKFLSAVGHTGLGLLDGKYSSNSTAAHIKDVFTLPKLAVRGATVSIKDQITNGYEKQADIYKNNGSQNVSYEATGKDVSIYMQPVEPLFFNGVSLPFQNGGKRLLATTPLTPNNSYFLILDDAISPIVPKHVQNLGARKYYKKAGIYKLGNNQIPNGSFEAGLWKSNVDDCHNYDSGSIISQKISNTASDGRQSLQLEATRHVACTSQKFKVQPGSKNVMSFEYKSPNTKLAGYYLIFNDKAKTVIQDQLAINTPNSWQHFLKTITVPDGVTSAVLGLYAYESDGRATNTVLYDNVTFRAPILITNIALPSIPDSFNKIGVSLPAGKNTFKLNSGGTKSGNLVNNPSFENGPWQPSVGDCNNADSNGKIAQSTNTSEYTAGRQSLQLAATRHIACTSTDLNIDTAGDYLFSFDYASPNAKQAGYNLQFNDPDKTVINEQLAIPNTTWQHFKKKVKVPPGASSVSLAIYAYASDGRTNNIVRYDNFDFENIPDVSNTFYLLTQPTQKYKVPRKINAKAINPTKYNLRVSGAQQPYIFSFAESFHSGWKLYMQPLNSANKPSGDISLIQKSNVFESSHVKLNGYSNGWVIDPAYIKSHYSHDYWRENDDGSIDFNMIIYFKPQSYFYVGLAISGATLCLCISTIAFLTVRNRRTKRLPDGVYSMHPTISKATK